MADDRDDEIARFHAIYWESWDHNGRKSASSMEGSMGIPKHEEPTPAPEDGMPERRNTRRKWMALRMTGVAAVLAVGAFLVAQTHDARRESLPEPKPLRTASEMVPATATSGGPAPASAAPAVSESSLASSPGATAESETGQTDTGGVRAPKKRSANDVREEINKARARAKADGIELQRPLTAKGKSEMTDGSYSQWNESTKNGSVRVTTAGHDLTDSSDLLPAGDGGKPVGDGVKCTNRVRFSQDAAPTTRPTLLVCWRTSSKRSVVTMMATPNGEPSAAANVSIINREWAKLH
jgi:hypothetical protein